MYFWKLPPPLPFKTIDTLKVTHRKFKMLSHKQDDVSKYRGNIGKIETNFKLWLDCYYGKKKALNHMKRYNARDVIGLEQNYLSLLPWISNHPNMAAGINRPVCPRCMSKRVWSEGLKPNKKWRTEANVYRLFRCQNCQSPIKGAANVLEYKPLRNA